MITKYLYWIADGDHAHGVGGAERIDALRRLWLTNRVAGRVGPFDGASSWVADGRAYARVIRLALTHASNGVEVIDISPSPLT